MTPIIMDILSNTNNVNSFMMPSKDSAGNPANLIDNFCQCLNEERGKLDPAANIIAAALTGIATQPEQESKNNNLMSNIAQSEIAPCEEKKKDELQENVQCQIITAAARNFDQVIEDVYSKNNEGEASAVNSGSKVNRDAKTAVLIDKNFVSGNQVNLNGNKESVKNEAEYGVKPEETNKNINLFDAKTIEPAEYKNKDVQQIDEQTTNRTINPPQAKQDFNMSQKAEVLEGTKPFINTKTKNENIIEDKTINEPQNKQNIKIEGKAETVDVLDANDIKASSVSKLNNDYNVKDNNEIISKLQTGQKVEIKEAIKAKSDVAKSVGSYNDPEIRNEYVSKNKNETIDVHQTDQELKPEEIVETADGTGYNTEVKTKEKYDFTNKNLNKLEAEYTKNPENTITAEYSKPFVNVKTEISKDSEIKQAVQPEAGVKPENMAKTEAKIEAQPKTGAEVKIETEQESYNRVKYGKNAEHNEEAAISIKPLKAQTVEKKEMPGMVVAAYNEMENQAKDLKATHNVPMNNIAEDITIDNEAQDSTIEKNYGYIKQAQSEKDVPAEIKSYGKRNPDYIDELGKRLAVGKNDIIEDNGSPVINNDKNYLEPEVKSDIKTNIDNNDKNRVTANEINRPVQIKQAPGKAEQAPHIPEQMAKFAVADSNVPNLDVEAFDLGMGKFEQLGKAKENTNKITQVNKADNNKTGINKINVTEDAEGINMGFIGRAVKAASVKVYEDHIITKTVNTNKDGFEFRLESGKSRKITPGADNDKTAEKVALAAKNQTADGVSSLDLNKSAAKAENITKAELPSKVFELVSNFHSSPGNGEKMIEISLTPEKLGKVEIMLKLNNGEVSPTFRCLPEAASVIRESIPELQKALASAGITLGESTIHSGFHQANGERQNGNNRESSGSSYQNSADSRVEMVEMQASDSSSRYSFLV